MNATDNLLRKGAQAEMDSWRNWLKPSVSALAQCDEGAITVTFNWDDGSFPFNDYLPLRINATAADFEHPVNIKVAVSAQHGIETANKIFH